MKQAEIFKNIILLHQPAMQRMAQHILHDPMAAEDAVQDALEHLWRRRHELLRAENSEAVCILEVKRRCIDSLRRFKPTSPIDEQALLAVDLPADNLEERYQEALRLVHRLPEMQRRAILLKYEDQKSTEEIAQQLQTSSSNIYTTLSRARDNLRKMLKHER